MVAVHLLVLRTCRALRRPAEPKYKYTIFGLIRQTVHKDFIKTLMSGLLKESP
jgi:hypothetical protein